MKPRVGKTKSKRISCRQRYKVEKKVREHHRKLRREGKDPRDGPKIKKDLGIPNLHPFKDALLKSAEAAKERATQEKMRQKIERQRLAAKQRTMEALQADAASRGAKFDAGHSGAMEELSTLGAGVNENSRRAYYKEFKKVVDAADVILQVLDARDPLGSRSPRVEQAVMQSGGKKKLVLVLNKIDLVPREVVEAWLVYLRKEFPTIAFKASTQTQKENLGHSSDTLSGEGSSCRGAGMLLKLLANYCRNSNIKTSIRVGIVGFPNVGKSSIINSLKRSRACAVAPTPGFTKTMQEVVLDGHVKLLDSPGIVFAKNVSDVELVLRNVVKLENVTDPIAPVDAILSRCSNEQLMLRYVIPSFSSTPEFLQHLSRRQGRLKKGGVPDQEAAARILLQDWIDGRLSYYTVPPANHEMPQYLKSTIVGELNAAFDIDALLKEEENAVLEGLPAAKDRPNFVEMTSSALMEGDLMSESEDDDDDFEPEDGDDDDDGEDDDDDEMEDDDDDDEMEEDDGDEEEGEAMSDDDENAEMLRAVNSGSKKKAVAPPSIVQTSVKPRHGKTDVIPKQEVYERGNGAQQNKANKKNFKKQQKDARRASAGNGSQHVPIHSTGANEHDDYNFNTDFVDV